MAHYVPDDVVRQRHKQVFEFVKENIISFDKIDFIDNTELTAKYCGQYENGNFEIVEEVNASWANDLIKKTNLETEVKEYLMSFNSLITQEQIQKEIYQSSEKPVKSYE